MSELLHDDDTKAIAIPPVFSENSQAKKNKGELQKQHFVKLGIPKRFCDVWIEDVTSSSLIIFLQSSSLSHSFLHLTISQTSPGFYVSAVRVF